MNMLYWSSLIYDYKEVLRDFKILIIVSLVCQSSLRSAALRALAST